MFQLLGSWAGLGKRYSFEILLSVRKSVPLLAGPTDI